MPKINVYLPDDLAQAVRKAGLPVSAVCQRALEQAVRRVTTIRETVLGRLDDADLAARLPHFTARARTSLRLAAEQARATGSPAVGTGHLLGGLVAEGSNLALQVLGVLELPPDRVAHALAARPLAEAPVADDTAERFSVPAANMFEMALTEATSAGHNYIGCEHLLLGLIAEPDGVGGQVLRSLGADVRLTRRAVAAALAGYVHLQAQAPPSAARDEAVAALSTAIRQELQPLVARIERLEERL